MAAMALVIILMTCLAAVFAYQVAPDPTPAANNMIIELGGRPPGFSCLLLRLPKTVVPRPAGIVAAFFSGTPSTFTEIPIINYWHEKGKLFVQHYVDEGMRDTLSFADSLVSRASFSKRTFLLGTDRYGRDILSRLVVGARVSLSVGLVAVLLSMTIGIFLGALAGYFGGLADAFIMWLLNILYAIPTILLVFAITLAIGKGFWELFIAIGLSMWIGAARITRGQVMAVKELDYIKAARALGLSNRHILFRHILPNISGPLAVVAAGNFAAAILTEAGLSFLGFGVQPPEPSWGLMIKEHYNFLLSSHPLPAIIPGLAIMLLVFCFNILGNAFRDILDVKS